MFSQGLIRDCYSTIRNAKVKHEAPAIHNHQCRWNRESPRRWIARGREPGLSQEMLEGVEAKLGCRVIPPCPRQKKGPDLEHVLRKAVPRYLGPPIVDDPHRPC